ncbi:hypothetical protein LSAT2_016950 [Lamellibrachia satsuma]|nr:hypothetical protein LSAT2_016950 [Lamellibrachia satsuma]
MPLENAAHHAVWAIFFHSLSTLDDPHHSFCSDTWCYWQQAQVEGVDPAVKVKQVKHDTTAQRCQPQTSNVNESLHATVWKRAPKSKYCGKKTTEIAVALAVMQYSKGAGALAVMQYNKGASALAVMQYSKGAGALAVMQYSKGASALAMMQYSKGAGALAVMQYSKVAGALAVMQYNKGASALAVMQYSKGAGALAVMQYSKGAGALAVMQYNKGASALAVMQYNKGASALAVMQYSKGAGTLTDAVSSLGVSPGKTLLRVTAQFDEIRLCVADKAAKIESKTSRKRRAMQKLHDNYLGKIATVEHKLKGRVKVQFSDGQILTYNEALLHPVDAATEQDEQTNMPFKRYDIVCIEKNKDKVKSLQQDHGGWDSSMVSVLGKNGIVNKVDEDGDVFVEFADKPKANLPKPPEFFVSDEISDRFRGEDVLSDLDIVICLPW